MLRGYQLLHVRYTGYASMRMDISIDIYVKSVDMDMDVDVRFHIRGNPGNQASTLRLSVW